MADIRFGAYSKAYYGDVVKAERPRSTGLTLVPINRYSGKPVVDTDVGYYGNKPEDIVEKLYKDGEYARGLINNKLYENGVEVSPEQAQAGHTFNYSDIKGELATLGIRTPVGTGGSQFVRDPAAEKKFVETVRANLKAGLMPFERVASASIQPVADLKALSAASDAELIAFVGGVNKEGVIGSGYGINAVYDVYSSNVATPGGTGYGTGRYGGTGPAPYVRGSRAITESDILALAKISSNPGDPQSGNANKQLISIFENDPSWLRREQARDAMSYWTSGSPDYDRAMAADAEDTTEGTIEGIEGKTPAPARVYTARDGLEFTDQMAFATYQTGLSAEQRALAAEARAAAEAEAKLKEAEFQKQFKNENAIISLTSLFEKYGLPTLVPKLKELVVAGYSDDTIEIQLSQTEEYQQRFRANKERIKKGLAVLDPATYINLEDKYRQVLKSYGLKQFDNDDYVTQFLENNTSVAEVTNRISLAVDRVKFADPMILETLRTYYPNINDTDLVAYMLDPENEEPKLMRQVQTAEVTAAARMQGLTPGKQYAEELVGRGVTKEMAQKGYATIADILPTVEKLSDIYGTTLPGYRQTQAEDEVFTNLASAKRKRIALTEREIAEFGGQSGVGRGSLGKQTGGTY